MSVCGNQGRTENEMKKQSVDLNGTARRFLPDYTDAAASQWVDLNEVFTLS